MDTKHCNTCDKTLSITQFSFRVKAKGTRQSKCKSCTLPYNRAYYSLNSVKCISQTNTRAAVRKGKLRKYIEDNMDLRCVKCGYDKLPALDFDHLDPATKEYNVSQLISSGCSLERLMNEIAKCRILCSNCHRLSTAKLQGWYTDGNYAPKN